MAKQSGLGDRLFIDGYSVGGDIQAVDRASGSVATIDCTSIEDSAMSRLGGLRDGALEATTYWNPGPEADAIHDVVKTLPDTDRVVSYARGTALGGQVFALVGKQINYDGTRGNSGEYTLKVSVQANGYGAQWGDLMTAGGGYLSTGAEDLDGVDGGAGTALGGTAMLHVLGFTGTSVTATLEDSDDDGSGDAYGAISGGAFTAATGLGSQRIQLGATQAVKRWVRVSLSGTYTSALVVVSFARHSVATVF